MSWKLQDERIRGPYILFGYDSFYPNGGLEDLHGQYETLEDAMDAAKKPVYEAIDSTYNFYAILECNTGKWWQLSPDKDERGAR